MKLGTPIQVGPMTFKNRTYHLPIGGPGHRSDEALNYYKARARGGVAALTTGGLADLDIMRNPTDELKRFADMVHSAAPDCYVGTQTLVLYGPEKKGSGIGPHGSGERGAAPSATWSPATEQSIANNFADPNPYEITREEIHAITEQLAEAAAGQKSAGYDFAELHATHAYIWRQFLSPMDNKREDEYGGSIENRIRWPVEAVRAMKAAAGEDFGITFRLAAMEPEFNGISLADSCRAAQLLQEAGVDALIISEGANSHNRGFISSCVPLQISYDRNCFAQWAEAIKKVVDIPVVAVGRITQPDEAEEILQSGQA
ncbi:MAG TPA: hypothetical protein QGF35_08435, partial [Dehalococcoidia bacterium]|nr:hypothetical protein [Dehalococcoidia bacterium]